MVEEEVTKECLRCHKLKSMHSYQRYCMDCWPKRKEPFGNALKPNLGVGIALLDSTGTKVAGSSSLVNAGKAVDSKASNAVVGGFNALEGDAALFRRAWTLLDFVKDENPRERASVWLCMCEKRRFFK